MTSVGCWNTECNWNKGGWCQRGMISISETLECEDFEDYRKSYTDQFWKACGKDGKSFRRLCEKGKKVEYNGYVFYTEDKIDDTEEYELTEERTGVFICSLARLKEPKRWDKFVSMNGTYPDVLTLPVVERSENEN